MLAASESDNFAENAYKASLRKGMPKKPKYYIEEKGFYFKHGFLKVDKGLQSEIADAEGHCAR